MQKGDSAAAWSLLSSKTQKEADRVARSIGDAGPESGRQMLFTSALPGEAVEPRLASQTGDSAEVQTRAPDGGMSRTWHLLREGGLWRIDLDLGH